jgi:undecaprenyl-phosphate galactose phosphotransferase
MVEKRKNGATASSTTKQKRSRGPRTRGGIDVNALLAKGEAILDEETIPARHLPFKRAFDILFALAALILASPILLVASLAVGLTSRGGVIYAASRIGRSGKQMRCYKLRTMYADAEARLRSILESCPDKAAEYASHRKLSNDPRITPIGHFLRRTSIDELPQLVNVLKGDLSIVGPRPYFCRELKELSPYQRASILCVRPGITGPWQTSGRSEIPFNERVEIEQTYALNLSWISDLGYIFKTIPALILSRGAK